jgi:hypothetical protein
MPHPNEDDLFSVSEVACEAGINRSTVQRWIKAGRLEKQAEGKIRLGDVLRCRDGQRTGAPHGIPPHLGGWRGSARQLDHATPFLDAKFGLQRLMAMLPGLINYHFQAGRKHQISQVIEVLGRALAFKEQEAQKQRQENSKERNESLRIKAKAVESGRSELEVQYEEAKIRFDGQNTKNPSWLDAGEDGNCASGSMHAVSD